MNIIRKEALRFRNTISKIHIPFSHNIYGLYNIKNLNMQKSNIHTSVVYYSNSNYYKNKLEKIINKSKELEIINKSKELEIINKPKDLENINKSKELENINKPKDLEIDNKVNGIIAKIGIYTYLLSLFNTSFVFSECVNFHMNNNMDLYLMKNTLILISFMSVIVFFPGYILGVFGVFGLSAFFTLFVLSVYMFIHSNYNFYNNLTYYIKSNDN
tara:strand:+ start:4416 stop:5060 length:645 start_codon:yes stop_codon:yes gene_type:complete